MFKNVKSRVVSGVFYLLLAATAFVVSHQVDHQYDRGIYAGFAAATAGLGVGSIIPLAAKSRIVVVKKEVK